MFLISDALAAPANAAAENGGLSSIFLMVGFVLIFYFMMLRPQAKRAKEHKNLMSSLAQGDEVISSGGILGKINRINDDFVYLWIAENVEIKIQKSAIVATVPKGTLKAI